MSRIRVASVIPTFSSGGVGTVCTYAAQALARRSAWDITLVSLHDSDIAPSDSPDGLKKIGLGLEYDCPRQFLQWLDSAPQDLIITSDVSEIEEAFPYLPRRTRHIVQIHDSVRRYRQVALRNQAWIDGVICVGRHIEEQLRYPLDALHYRGLLGTVHNGAEYPPLKPRKTSQSKLRLLYLGRIDALKGVFDLVPILQELRKRGVPVELTIAGGESHELRAEFRRKQLETYVTWAGYVPHRACYEMAAESDLLMMTSRREPFGMVTIESMSMGCVPVAYHTPSGSSEIIEHGKSGMLVPLGDFSHWASVIQALHLDRGQLACLSEGAIARARNEFSADRMANSIELFADKVLQNSQRSPPLRMSGHPPVRPSEQPHKKSVYQFLPSPMRKLLRNRLHSHPTLSYWLLSR